MSTTLALPKMKKVEKLKKDVVITIDNIHTQKLSDVMESVIWDVRAAVKAGFTIDMDMWLKKNGPSNSQCSVCLGGSAILGFMTPPPSHKQIVCTYNPYQETEMVDDDATIACLVGEKNVDKVWDLANALDNYRSGDDEFAYQLQDLLGLDDMQLAVITSIIEEMGGLECFNGILSKSDIERIISNIWDLVVQLRRFGL